MKKTFTTVIPDEIGVFLSTSHIFTELNLNITRISYNKAVDTHMLFVELDGEDWAIAQAEKKLREMGYLLDTKTVGNVILLELWIKNECGALQPILQLINQWKFNISYMSAHENATEFQHFKMGLLVENDEDIIAFLRSVTQLCHTKIVSYNPTGLNLDNTVFYMSFANNIAEQNNLTEDDKRGLLIDSNLIMEYLTEQNSAPYKTFNYISKFAESLIDYKGERFQPQITDYTLPCGYPVTVIEPPCGSNMTIIATPNRLIAVDSGFSCYRKELLKVVQSKYETGNNKGNILLLTHADIDHVGLIDIFKKIYVSQQSYDNFLSESNQENSLRELIPHHAPYVRISKGLSHYKTPPITKLRVIGGRENYQGDPLVKIGDVKIDGLHFEVYEGRGGHMDGSIIYIERTERIIFTGDIFVNIKGFSKHQAKFNKIAPYLVSSVDRDSAIAAEDRKYIFNILEQGKWLLIGGHGAALEIEV
ncbi:MAG: Zn-dependent hydrolase [Bacillota bacterium]